MSLDSLSGVLGEFWLPTDKSNKVPGLLTIEPASSTRELSLQGCLSEPLSNSNHKEPVVIHGYIGETPVTLSRCLCTYQTFPLETEKYYVPLVIYGTHVKDETKLIVRRVILQLDGLSAWIPPEPIRPTYSEVDRKRILNVSTTIAPIIESSSAYFGSIDVIKTTSVNFEIHKVEVTKQSAIRIQYSKARSIYGVLEHCGIICNLVAMSTSAPCSVKTLDITVTLKSAFNVYIDLNWVENSTSREPLEHEVITYTELGGVEALAKCLDVSRDKNNHAVLRRLGSFWRSGEPFNESKFIRMTVALEYLYKATGYPSSKKGGGKVDLEDKLNAVIRPIADDIALIIPNMEWLGRKIARYRGWAAHAISDDPPEGLLFILMCSLYLCIWLRYVYELEANVKEICSKVHSMHMRFREWDNVLKEAMEENP